MVGVELYTVRSVLGYSEIFWAFRQIVRRRRSCTWATIKATVEGYEFLAARQNGWLVIFYSYEFAGELYSGELRTWLMLRYPGDEEPVSDVITRFPRGTQIDACVDPRHPARSVSWI